MLATLITGLGVALAIEGLAYAAAPGAMKRLAAAVGLANPAQLRAAGLVALGLSVVIVAIGRHI